MPTFVGIFCTRNMMNIAKVVKSTDVRTYFLNLIELMQSYTGNHNRPDVIDKVTGEVLVWDNRDEHCANYALIGLQDSNDLTPLDKTVKKKLLASMMVGTTACLRVGDKMYVISPYGGEIRNAIVVIGLCVRLIDKRIKL